MGRRTKCGSKVGAWPLAHAIHFACLVWPPLAARILMEGQAAGPWARAESAGQHYTPSAP
jgi:hypothetical protein